MLYRNNLAIYQDITFKVYLIALFCVVIKSKFLFHLTQMTHLRLIEICLILLLSQIEEKVLPNLDCSSEVNVLHEMKSHDNDRYHLKNNRKFDELFFNYIPEFVS